MTLTASCHCGAVSFSVETPPSEITTCDCSLCTKRNAQMAYTPEAEFKMLSDWSTVAEYRWNTKVARHYFCKICGIYTFHKPRTRPNYYGYNINCLNDFDKSQLPDNRVHGSELSLEPNT